MDPQVPQAPQTPQPPFQASTPAPLSPRPKWWRSPKKVLLVVGGLLVLIFLGASLFMGLNGSKNDKSGDSGSVYHDRPEFDRKSLSPAIGDPAALAPKPGTQVVTYKGEKVIQACNVLTVDDLHKNGFLLDPNGLPNLERNYFDGKSTATVESESILTGSGRDGNTCWYPLLDGHSLIIDVFQPSYLQPRAIPDALKRNFQAAGESNGLKLYTYSKDKSTYYLLHNGSSALQIHLLRSALKGAADVDDKKLLSLASASFVKELQNPTAPWITAYDTPVFTKNFANSCDLIAPADVKKIFGVEATPWANEKAATATSVIRFEENGPSYSYIRHECTRQPVSGEAEIFSFTTRSLELTASTYMDPQGAQKWFAFTGRSNPPAVDDIGDEAFIQKDVNGTNVLTVRQGRLLLELSYHLSQHGKSKVSDEEAGRVLTDVGKDVLARAQGY